MADQLPSFGRLRWLCRRGTKELDRILGGYLEQDFSTAEPTLQHAFVTLLGRQDPDIYDWLMGASKPDDVALIGIVECLQKKYGIFSDS